MYQPILELLSSFRCWRIFYSVNCYITELLFEKYFFSQISFGFLFFSLFNFQGSISLPLARQLTEYITSSLPCQVLFLTFFKVFRDVFKVCLSVISFFHKPAPLPLRTFVYRILSLVFPLVNSFFALFYPFSSLFVHPPVCFWGFVLFIYYILYFDRFLVFAAYILIKCQHILHQHLES